MWVSATVSITNSLLADNRTGSSNAAAMLMENANTRQISLVTVAYSTTTTSPAITLVAGALHLLDIIIADDAVGMEVRGYDIEMDEVRPHVFLPLVVR